MIPEELKSGDRLEAGWLNRMVRAIVARTVNAGPGLLKTMTPAGTTLSLAHQRRTAAGVSVSADFDFPWKVTVTPIAGGSNRAWTLAMQTGYTQDIASGEVYRHDLSTRTIDAGGWVYFSHPQSTLEPYAVTVFFDASIPASDVDIAYVPVAEVSVDSDGAHVTQYLAWMLRVLRGVPEEV